MKVTVKVTPVRAIGWLGVLFTVAMILLSVIVQDLPSSTRLGALVAEDLQRPLRSAVVVKRENCICTSRANELKPVCEKSRIDWECEIFRR